MRIKIRCCTASFWCAFHQICLQHENAVAFSHITPRKVFLSVLCSFLMNVYFVYSLMNVHKVDMDHSSTAFKLMFV